MRLEEFIEGLEHDEEHHKRQLAQEKSYAITEYLTDVERQIDETLQGDSLFGSTAPSIFVGRSGYPRVSAGVLAPVAPDVSATDYVTSGEWYRQGVTIDDVFQARAGLLNSTQPTDIHVADEWDGFTGVRREVAIADRPVDVEVDLETTPTLDMAVDRVATPRGPRAHASDAQLTENPHVPRAVEKTLSDDDWRAEGAMTYLYNRGFDVYDINTILSAGALGQRRNRTLVPTRWSITAVDDTVSQFLRGSLRNAATIDAVEVRRAEYLGNQFWVILAPGNWEFELVEMKSPGSVWSPGREGYWVASDYEGFGGRTQYVEETSGAYYAARLAVLEHLTERDRQAKALVLRDVTDEYWGPVGVWLIRETVRDAVSSESATAQSFHGAIAQLQEQLPIESSELRRNSELVAGVQSDLSAFLERNGR
ncbi:DNA repair protein NreA [Halocatena salina]|uniref:DNA repair protein n=1 Tax=Halocatena salina TaxID=2934340 RepID=A0A8U0A363_9EURY|nr:DNA repair protein NreA [Halocatena salina]UPM42417.1 Nre family DNA repair protein [Halocatena salina]